MDARRPPCIHIIPAAWLRGHVLRVDQQLRPRRPANSNVPPSVPPACPLSTEISLDGHSGPWTAASRPIENAPLEGPTDLMSWSAPSPREFDASATAERRSPWPCSNHACNCRCARPWGPPDPGAPPCIRHLLFPATEGDRQGLPVPGAPPCIRHLLFRPPKGTGMGCQLVLAPHRAALRSCGGSWAGCLRSYNSPAP